jgi:hypothetical protein
MTEAEQFLRETLEHGDIIGLDVAGGTILQLAWINPTFDRLMTSARMPLRARMGQR